MAGNDTMGHRQPQAGPAPHFLGGEEGVKNAWQVLGRDPGPRVGHAHPDRLAGTLGADREHARAPRHGVLRIRDEVQEHLPELMRVGEDPG